MALLDMLLRKKTAIGKRWFEQILSTYPPDTAKFLKNEPDRFQNPVGGTIIPAIDGVLTVLLAGGDAEQLRSHLDRIIRIRAVQDFTASEAVEFVFRLKQVIREEAGIGTNGQPLSDLRVELQAVDARIDTTALMAFDVYMECREQIYEIKARDLRNRTAAILRKHNYVVDDVVSDMVDDIFPDGVGKAQAPPAPNSEG